ncbi:MAG: hypothetical protein GEV28_31725 [Actinophytocola sp.]|uniref:DddA-like double-stranded DNA deaminase toxin n=1 Tax=Actinophytocola sp. TaxID=1872138 RepID=UPI001320E7BD|nr:DddA-like double-stranded DNA deaminase toxin [Actinophytocola sp.]MPZ84708.1 hypothetical protein [Actinophytocola sp.]
MTGRPLAINFVCGLTAGSAGVCCETPTLLAPGCPFVTRVDMVGWAAAVVLTPILTEGVQAVRRFVLVVLAVVAVFWVFDPFGDELPEATDSGWVAEQRAALEGKRLTTGRFKSTEHDTLEVTSGWRPISDRIVEVLRNSPHFPPFPGGRPNVAGDVETKVAMMMREAEATTGVVVINNDEVCSGPMGCTAAVPVILPEGSTLYVWERNEDEPVTLTGKG